MAYTGVSLGCSKRETAVVVPRVPAPGFPERIRTSVCSSPVLPIWTAHEEPKPLVLRRRNIVVPAASVFIRYVFGESSPSVFCALIIIFTNIYLLNLVRRPIRHCHYNDLLFPCQSVLGQNKQHRQ